MREGFRPIAGRPGYWVSADGLLASERHRNGKPGGWLILRPFQKANGYLQVVLYVNKLPEKLYVHRAVLEAFVGPCPEGMQARHLNGNRQDNRAANLAWGTVQDNADDRAAHGTQIHGSQCHQSRFSEADIVRMRERRAAGIPRYAIAAEFATTPEHVSRICYGAMWARAGGPIMKSRQTDA